MADRTLRNSLLSAGIGAGAATFCAVVGWSLFEFDRALFTYAQALIVSFALIVYRFSIWVHRPPTKAVFRQAWDSWKSAENRLALVAHVVRRGVGYFGLNVFVWKRGLNRWGAHWPIALGCVMAFAIVLPLIFGWVWFETRSSDFSLYTVMVLGVPVRTISVDSFEAFVAFHGLVWASFPVIVGCVVSLWRRLHDRGDQAVQTVVNDFLPPVVLLLISVTGLLMTVSYSFLEGAFHEPLAQVHMLIVCGTLLWLPYSKLFHVPQRSLKLAHMVCEHAAESSGSVCCSRCGEEFATRQQVENLIAVQKELGYRYELEGAASHYQMVCPQCRRASLVLAQGVRWRSSAESNSVPDFPEPVEV